MTISKQAALESEAFVLGAAMLGADLPDLKAVQFADPRHGLIWNAINWLPGEDVAPDLLTVTGRLREQGFLDRAGGEDYIAGLTSLVNTTKNVPYHADIVRKEYRRRRLLEISQTVIEEDGNIGPAKAQELLKKLDEAKGGGAAPNFKIRRLGTGEVKAPVWIIKNFIVEGAFIILYAASGVGKSFFALAMAACVALGIAFYGHRVKQGGVLYLCAEGQSGLEARLAAFAKHNRVSLEDAPLYINQTPVNLIADSDLMASRIVGAAEGIPGLRLIFIDTWSRNLGGDDSAPKDAAIGVGTVDTIKAAMPGVSVVVIHHTGLANKERARGWGGLYNAADTSFRLERTEGLLVLEADKMKDGPLPPRQAWQQVTVPLGVFDEDGAELTSLVFDKSDYVPTDGGSKKPTPAQDEVLEICREIRGTDGGADKKKVVETYTVGMKNPRQAWSKVFTAMKDNGKIFERYGKLYEDRNYTGCNPM